MKHVYELPAEMKLPAKKKGTVELFRYSSSTYEGDNSRNLRKKAYVYLPYGYDEKKEYNVLYLLHGGGCGEDFWLKWFPDTVDILDNMFEKNLCEPCIIVTPTYYHNKKDRKHANEFRTENFWQELRNDLIPSLEKKYSTFTKGDVSQENLVATRNHRGISGLSLGSMTTYRSGLYRNFDLFSWYGPMSGCTGPFGNRDNEVKRICETLENGRKNGYELDYLFCFNGDKDIAFAEHKEIMEKAEKACKILKKDENYDFMIIPGGVHDMKAWQLDLYHVLQVFFRK